MYVSKVENPEELMLKLATGNKRPRKLQGIIEKFALSEDKIVEVTFYPDEYVSSRSAHGSLTNACKRSGYNIKAKMMGGKLYLVKEAAL